MLILMNRIIILTTPELFIHDPLTSISNETRSSNNYEAFASELSEKMCPRYNPYGYGYM